MEHTQTQKKYKIMRVSTMPVSLDIFCRGFLRELSADYEVGAVSSPSALLNELGEREGVAVHGVKMSRSISPIADLRAIMAMRSLFKREKPDMVHSMTPKAGLLAMTAARLAGVPHRVHTFTGLLFPTAKGIMKTLYASWDKAICSSCTSIIAEGHGVKSDLERAQITNKRIDVLGHGNVRGVDLRHYSPSAITESKKQELRNQLGLSDNLYTFIYVGRITPDKGIAELIGAFEALQAQRACARLLMVGGTLNGDEQISRELTLRISSNSSIINVPWTDDVRPYYAIANALILPSYREGFPNAVLEAGAMQLPAIVTNINGSREIITDGVNGTIVSPRSSQELYDSMISYVDQPAKYASMGLAAREIIADRYEIDYVRQCQKTYYHEILS